MGIIRTDRESPFLYVILRLRPANKGPFCVLEKVIGEEGRPLVVVVDDDGRVRQRSQVVKTLAAVLR